ITCLISLMPHITALKGTNSERELLAMRRAKVVFPQPGGPQKSMETMSSRSICVRRGFPAARSSSWPTTSSSVRGRMRSASGRVPRAPSFSDPSGSMARKRFMVLARDSFRAAALARGFIENKRCRDGSVQGFYRLRKLDANERVGAAFNFGREAGAFVADEKRDGLAKIEAAGVTRGGIFRGRSGDDFQPRDAELRERDRSSEFGNYGQAKDGACGRAQGFGRMRMRGAAQGNGAGCAEGFSGAQNCADVARVLHAGENDDERVAAAKKVFECESRRAQQSGDALRRFRGGDGGEEFVGGAQNDRGMVEFREERSEMRFGGRAGEDGFQFKAGAKRFGNQAKAFETDALAFGPRGLQNRAKQFQPMVFARGDCRALRGARRGGFG